MAQGQTRIIAVANEKGGVGKTVSVINLGAALSAEGLRVLVVDMDPQFNATQGLGIVLEADEPSVYDLMKTADGGSEPVAAADVVQETAWEHLHVIPAHIDLAGAEIELVNELGRENRLKEALAPIESRYDVILLDTPPSLSLLTINVFAYAREVIVPCQTHPYAFGALEDLFDTIDGVAAAINPDLRATGVVATFYDGRTRVSRDILDRLQSDDRTKTILFETVIRANTTIAESAGVQKPVVFYRRASSGAKDYHQLAQEVMARTA